MRSKNLMIILNIISWIIFIGLCIDAGSFVVNIFFSWYNPNFLPRLMLASEMDLSSLGGTGLRYFRGLLIFMALAAMLKATMFYQIIMVMYNKRVNLNQPFTVDLARFMGRVAYLCLAIGLICWMGLRFVEWVAGKGYDLPDSNLLRIGGADVWLFMGVVLLVFAQMFWKGIELQKENDLTI